MGADVSQRRRHAMRRTPGWSGTAPTTGRFSRLSFCRSGTGSGLVFDLAKIDARITVVPFGGGERVVLSNGLHRIGLTIVKGSTLSGPDHARFRLDYRDGIDAQILTLRRLLAILERAIFKASVQA